MQRRVFPSLFFQVYDQLIPLLFFAAAFADKLAFIF